MSEHRSFPEAGNGLPILPMQVELWAAGCDHETSRFVARHLDASGYTLIHADLIEALESERDALAEKLKRAVRGVKEAHSDMVDNDDAGAFRILRATLDDLQETPTND